MEKWTTPTTPQEIQAFNEGLELERYRAARDTPATYVAPAPATEVNQDFEIKPRYIKAVAFLGGGLAVGYSVVAFVAAYAVQIGAVVGAVVGAVALVGVVVSGLKKGEHGEKKTSSEPPPGGSGEWEWYQEQRQGWRRKTNNN